MKILFLLVGTKCHVNEDIEMINLRVSTNILMLLILQIYYPHLYFPLNCAMNLGEM